LPDEEAAMADRDDVSLSRETRERFHALLKNIRDADTERELMLYIERFFGMQSELRHYFTLVEREIADKLREFRAVEEHERPRVLDQPNDLRLRRDRERGDTPHDSTR
jgi:hypothetical protein